MASKSKIAKILEIVVKIINYFIYFLKSSDKSTNSVTYIQDENTNKQKKAEINSFISSHMIKEK